MSKTLAELRESPHRGLPEHTYSLCLAPKLMSKIRGLVDDLQEAEAVAAAQRDEDATKTRPRRAGEASPVLKIREELRELHSEVEDHTGALTLRGISPDEWAAWCDEHPARKDNPRDREAAFGYCNADDLRNDLARYAKVWNDEEIPAGVWDAEMAPSVAPGDLKELVQLVVSMHEMAVDVPKLLSDLLGIVDAETA